MSNIINEWGQWFNHERSLWSPVATEWARLLPEFLKLKGITKQEFEKQLLTYRRS